MPTTVCYTFKVDMYITNDIGTNENNQTVINSLHAQDTIEIPSEHVCFRSLYFFPRFFSLIVLKLIYRTHFHLIMQVVTRYKI